MPARGEGEGCLGLRRRLRHESGRAAVYAPQRNSGRQMSGSFGRTKLRHVSQMNERLAGCELAAVRWTFRLPAVTCQSARSDPVIPCTSVIRRRGRRAGAINRTPYSTADSRNACPRTSPRFPRHSVLLGVDPARAKYAAVAFNRVPRPQPARMIKAPFAELACMDSSAFALYVRALEDGFAVRKCIPLRNTLSRRDRLTLGCAFPR